MGERGNVVGESVLLNVLLNPIASSCRLLKLRPAGYLLQNHLIGHDLKADNLSTKLTAMTPAN